MTAKVFAAINDQINSEFQASYNYLAMAGFCDQQKFGAVKRSCKVVFQIAGASIAMGLKQGHYSPPRRTSC